MQQATKNNQHNAKEENEQSILQIEDVKKHFKDGKSAVKAVDGITLDVKYNETLGVVGESGCGKSTLGRTIAQLYNATGGNIYFKGSDVSKMTRKELKEIRREMQVIFQDPYSSLNPRMTVGDIIGEPLDLHKITRGKQREERIKELLELVGLDADHMSR